MKSKCFLIVAGLLLVLFSYSPAQVPQLINYQGKLTKSTGAPLDTTISMVFSIYADSAGTILKWTETQGAVVVEKGIFNVLLGNVNPIPDTVFDGNIRYLGVKVGGDPEITPRKPMVSVPYAYRTGTGAGDNDWTINGDTVYHLNGNVGIGTTSPMRTLHIASPTTSNEFVMEVKDGLADWRKWNFVVNGGTGNKQDLHLRILNDAGDNTTAGIMSWLNNGNVGIGTTSPNEQLELTGNLRLPPSTASVGVIKSGPYRFIHNFGTDNFFAGVNAGNFTLSGFGGNTGVGMTALQALTTGFYNTAVGIGALYYNSTGNSNTAVGYYALARNTTGYYNTAMGLNALYNNTTGYSNTAVGQWALTSNTTGANNAAMGRDALVYNTTGYENTAVGQSALTSNTTGFYNTAVGLSALWSNTTGPFNTAVGRSALFSNTTGPYNTAIGYGANVSTGGLSNATAIGSTALVDASNKVRIGNTSVTSIGGQVGWTTFSDGRFKKSISQNVPGLDFISKLKPVTYTVDVDAIDAALKPARKPREGQTEDAFKLTAEEMASRQAQSQIVYTGFIAQEVEKAARETGYDFSGVDAPKNAEGMYGLRYAEFVVPLVKAVQEQQESIKGLQEIIKEQQEQIKALQQMVADLKQK